MDVHLLDKKCSSICAKLICRFFWNLLVLWAISRELVMIFCLNTV